MNLRSVFLATALLGAASTAMAQEAPPSAAKTATVRGVVRDASTGQSLPDYVVNTFVPGLPVSNGPVSATTDAQGGFQLAGLAPGQYTLSIGSGRTLPIASRVIHVTGEDISDLDIRVPAEGRVSGRVMDQFKEPVAGMTVFLVSREYYRGSLQHVFRASANTDRSGRFTLAHVPSGRPLLLLATLRKGIEAPLPARSDVPADPELRRQVPAPTFYPNAPQKQGAMAILLRSGEHRENVDIEIRKAPGFCIAGNLDDGIPQKQFAIEPTEARMGAANGFNYFTRQPQVAAAAGGEFRLCELPPGTYRLSSFALPEDGVPRFALSEVTILDRDLAGVRLSPSPVQRLEGEVVWDGEQPKDAPSARFRLTILPVSHGPFKEESRQADAAIPGSFTLPTLLLDDYSLRATVTGSGLYIKDLQYAGQSVLHRPFRPGSALQGAGLKAVIGQDGAILTAQVLDGDGKPVSDAVVVLFPKNAESEPELADALVSGLTDQFGQYVSGALPPGSYYVFATRKSIDYSPESIGAISRSRSRFVEVALEPNANRQIPLKPIAIE